MQTIIIISILIIIEYIIIFRREIKIIIYLALKTNVISRANACI